MTIRTAAVGFRHEAGLAGIESHEARLICGAGGVR